jgi:plasmid maintenance system antidote protein VapI
LDVKQTSSTDSQMGAPGITAEMALKLGAALGTSQEVWLNAQEAVDLFSAGQLVEALPRRIRKAI